LRTTPTLQTIRVVDDRRAFVIEDELEGDGVHDFELNFQLAPNRSAEVAAAENGILCRILGDGQIQLAVAGPTRLQGAVQPSLISTIYGATVPAMKVRIRGRAAVPALITTRISWTEVADRASRQPGSAKEIKIHEAVAKGVCQA
jgi:hypothetical protein